MRSLFLVYFSVEKMVERRVHWPVAWTPGNTDFYCVYLALKTLFGPYSELYVNNRRNIPQFGRWRNSVVCRKVKNLHQHALFYAFTMSSQNCYVWLKKNTWQLPRAICPIVCRLQMTPNERNRSWFMVANNIHCTYTRVSRVPNFESRFRDWDYDNIILESETETRSGIWIGKADYLE